MSSLPRKPIDSDSFTYQYLTTQEGLSNQRVFSILEDKKGFIWISTHASVCEEKDRKEEEECTNCLSAMDKEFMQHCTQLVTDHLADADFTINQLCRELALSRTLFYEKLKAFTGQAPNEFIRLIRMNEAARLLKQQVPVQEVALWVGFTDAKYFSTAFKKHFGVSPSTYSN